MEYPADGDHYRIERRCRWRVEEKLRIVAECERPGACLAAVAHQHDVSSGLLWNWRRQVRRGVLRADLAVNFFPVQMTDEPISRDPGQRSRSLTVPSGMPTSFDGQIEIMRNRCESSTYATRWRSVEATRRQDSAGGTMDNASFNGMHQDRHAEGADRRIELITGTVRRRRSTIEEKAAIVAESPCAGVNVADVARRFGVNRGLLQTWRRKAIGEAPIFVPLRVEEPIAAADGARDRANTPRSVAAEADTSPRPATLEIESGVVRARFSGPVDATTLRLVMMHIGRHA